MEKVWVVASGKGGTGKSTVVANLGAALAAEGRRVLLVDLNVGLRCLDLCLGMDDRVLFDIMDVLEGTCRARDAILPYPGIATLFLLPAAQNRLAADFDGQRMQILCAGLSKEYDLIFLDCPLPADQRCILRQHQCIFLLHQHLVLLPMPQQWYQSRLFQVW